MNSDTTLRLVFASLSYALNLMEYYVRDCSFKNKIYINDKVRTFFC